MGKIQGHDEGPDFPDIETYTRGFTTLETTLQALAAAERDDEPNVHIEIQALMSAFE